MYAYGPCCYQVVEWVLGNVQSVWTDQQWQQRVASPAAFLKHYMPVQYSPQGLPEVPSLPTLYLSSVQLAGADEIEIRSFSIHAVTGHVDCKNISICSFLQWKELLSLQCKNAMAARSEGACRAGRHSTTCTSSAAC